MGGFYLFVLYACLNFFNMTQMRSYFLQLFLILHDFFYDTGLFDRDCDADDFS